MQAPASPSAQSASVVQCGASSSPEHLSPVFVTSKTSDESRFMAPSAQDLYPLFDPSASRIETGSSQAVPLSVSVCVPESSESASVSPTSVSKGPVPTFAHPIAASNSHRRGTSRILPPLPSRYHGAPAKNDPIDDPSRRSAIARESTTANARVGGAGASLEREESPPNGLDEGDQWLWAVTRFGGAFQADERHLPV